MHRLWDTSALVGLFAFCWGGVGTLAHDAIWLVGGPPAALTFAAIQPADVQPWLSLVNTALLTLGGTLIFLRQRWLRADADRDRVRTTREDRATRAVADTRHDQLIERLEQVKCPMLESGGCCAARAETKPTDAADAKVPG